MSLERLLGSVLEERILTSHRLKPVLLILLVMVLRGQLVRPVLPPSIAAMLLSVRHLAALGRAVGARGRRHDIHQLTILVAPLPDDLILRLLVCVIEAGYARHRRFPQLAHHLRALPQ